MKSYRQVIEEIVGKELPDKENLHPNLPSKTEEQLRKVNYRLQQEKEEMIQEMLILRQSYLKMKKKAEVNERKRSSAEGKLNELTLKYERTEAVKAKMQRRLYSSKSISGNTQRSLKSSSVKEQTSHGANVLAMLTRDSDRQHFVNQSVQTEQRVCHDMSVQAELPDPTQKKQLGIYKRKVKQLEEVVQLQAKIISDLQCATSATSRTHRTERLAGRIVKSKKTLGE